VRTRGDVPDSRTLVVALAAAGVAVAAALLAFLGWMGVIAAVVVVVVLGVGFAVRDIDRAMNRALVWVLLFGLVLGISSVIAGAAGAIAHRDPGESAAIYAALVALALTPARERLQRVSKVLLASGAGMTCLAWRIGALSRTAIAGAALQQSCVALCFAGFLAYLLARRDSPAHRVLRLRALGWLGEISYGTYLSHLLVLDAFNRVWSAFERPAPATFAAVVFRAAVCLGATVLLARAMRTWIELPCAAWRRRLAGEAA